MAEFERAIFRVYERCLEGLRDDDNETDGINTKSCRAFEILSLSGAFFFLITLIFLHFSFVGRPGCLPVLLAERAQALNLSSPNLQHDQILQITVDRRYAPNVDNSGMDSLKTVTDDGGLDGDGTRRRQLRRSLGGLYTLDEIDSEDDVSINSQTHTSSKNGDSHAHGKGHKDRSLRNVWHEKNNHMPRGWDMMLRMGNRAGDIVQSMYSHVMSNRGTSVVTLSSVTNTTTHNTTNHTTNGTTNIVPKKYSRGSYDFEFAYDVGILALPEELLFTHHFEIVNITLAGTRCFGNVVLQDLLPLGGIDTVVMNTIMYTVKKGGTLVSSTGDYYSWYSSDIYPYHTILGWLGFKIGVLLASLFAFFFLSSVTALLVRVLISSGVVLLFPMFWVLQYFGVQIISSRIISLSYPWIGLPMEIYRANQQSSIPFVLSHITRVIIYYSVYEASQLAFAEWFYGQGRPSQRELWLFAIMMLWEYYSMIYIRSANSILLFPRASLALFLLYHFYLFSHPSGFHLLALLVLFLFLTALMIYCVRKFEFEAYHRGLVNIDQPRALRNNLPWPTWAVALAPDYTLFMPVTIRSSTLYQNNVPPPPPGTGATPTPTPPAGGAGGASGGVNSPTTPVTGNGSGNGNPTGSSQASAGASTGPTPTAQSQGPGTSTLASNQPGGTSGGGTTGNTASSSSSLYQQTNGHHPISAVEVELTNRSSSSSLGGNHHHKNNKNQHHGIVDEDGVGGEYKSGVLSNDESLHPHHHSSSRNTPTINSGTINGGTGGGLFSTLTSTFRGDYTRLDNGLDSNATEPTDLLTGNRRRFMGNDHNNHSNNNNTTISNGRNVI